VLKDEAPREVRPHRAGYEVVNIRDLQAARAQAVTRR